MTEQIERIKPVLILFGVLVVSALLAYAWGAYSVAIKDTGIWQLEVSYQGIYVQAVADAYALDGNNALAADRLSFICQDTQKVTGDNGEITQVDGLTLALNEAEKRYGSDPVKKANLDELRNLAAGGQVVQNQGVDVCNQKPTNKNAGLLRTASMLLLFLMGVGIVGWGVWQIIQAGEQEAAAPAKPGEKPAAAAPAAGEKPAATTAERRKPTLPAIGRRKKTPEAEDTVRSAAAAGAQISAKVEKTDFDSIGVDPPIVQFMTTYLHGDDLYDDSFSIETSSGEFLGETGVGISETIGASEQKNVSAFEIWLFDKNDIRTVTKVLMSDHAYNDDTIRAKLAPKGEAMLAKVGDRLILDTATLRIQARLVDFSYGSGPLPPNSFFERITIELAAWKRNAQAGAPPPAGGETPSPQKPPLPRPPGRP